MTQRPRLLLGNMLAIGFVGATMVLSLSDRVGLAAGVVSRRGLALLFELERTLAVDVLDRSDVPFETDALGHAVLWGLAMLMIGWSFGRRAPLTLLGSGVFGLSLAVEVGQHLWSINRTAQLDDAVANLAGIALATTILLVWRHRPASRRSPGPRHSQPQPMGLPAQDPVTDVE